MAYDLKRKTVIEKGDAVRMGCLGCLSAMEDNEVLDIHMVGKPTENWVHIIARCQCGAVNMYRFRHMGTTPLTPGATIEGRGT